MRRAGKKNPESLVRFYLVVAVLCALLVLLVGRVLSLQIIEGKINEGDRVLIDFDGRRMTFDKADKRPKI